jgi:formate-nitrite transporter family protein
MKRRLRRTTKMSISNEEQKYLPLEESEKREIEKRVTVGAVVVHEAIRLEGEAELNRHPIALMWSGLAAGLSMGFSFLASVLLDAYLPGSPSWHPLVYSIGYAVGFLIVVLGRQQLFTENTLTAVLPLLYRRDFSCLISLLRLWGIVLAANLVGTLLFAVVLAYTNLLQPEYGQILVDLASRSIHLAFWETMLRAVFAGWLIALMVWLLPVAETARVWIVLIITYLVGLGNFPHIIAGSTEAIYATFIGLSTPWGFVHEYLLPTLLGNTLGGVVFVAILNHAQAVGGRRK